MLLRKVSTFRLLQFSEKKDYCEDITEGKFSFPIIRAIKSRPDDNQVSSILLLFISVLQLALWVYNIWLILIFSYVI